MRDRAPRVRIKSPQVAYMNRVALKTFSYFDTGMQPLGAEPERFHHGFVLGFWWSLAAVMDLHLKERKC